VTSSTSTQQVCKEEKPRERDRGGDRECLGPSLPRQDTSFVARLLTPPSPAAWEAPSKRPLYSGAPAGQCACNGLCQEEEAPIPWDLELHLLHDINRALGAQTKGSAVRGRGQGPGLESGSPQTAVHH
jgi:hypothetical protein